MWRRGRISFALIVCLILYATDAAYVKQRFFVTEAPSAVSSSAFPGGPIGLGGWRPSHPILVDFDGDGWVDWVAIAINGTFNQDPTFFAQPIWVPNRNGTWDAPIPIGRPFRSDNRYQRLEAIGSTFAVGDLDRDGFNDIVILERATVDSDTGASENILYWLRNSGDHRTFTQTSFFAGISPTDRTVLAPVNQQLWNQTYGITLCDFDNDGDLDVMYSFFYYQEDGGSNLIELSLSALRNDVTGPSSLSSWTPLGWQVPLTDYLRRYDGGTPVRGFLWRRQGMYGRSNGWTDATGSRNLDFSSISSGRNGLRVLGRYDRTRASWDFAPFPQLGNLHYESTIGDLNGDGIMDVVATVPNPPLTIPIILMWYGKSNVSFGESQWTSPWVISLPQLWTPSVFLRDINGDGLIDIIVAGSSKTSIEDNPPFNCSIRAILNQGADGIPIDDFSNAPNPFNPPVIVDVLDGRQLLCPYDFVPFAAEDFDKDGSPEILLLRGIGSTAYTVSLCGNGQRNDGEECDFNALNVIAGSCSQECTCVAPFAFNANTSSCVICGNGLIDANEECDFAGVDSNRQNSTVWQGCSRECGCNRPLWVRDTRLPFGCTKCGNGQIDTGEICEPAINGSSCDPITCQCASGFSFDPSTNSCVGAAASVVNLPSVIVPSVISVLVLIAAVIITVILVRRARERAKALKALALPALNFSAVSEAVHNMMSIDSSDIKLEKEVGRGAFGIVYKGTWKKVDVAVKKAANMTQDQLESFIEEAVFMIKNVSPHPNIVQFYGACIDPVPIIVMEWLNNGAMDSLLDDAGVSISTGQMVQWMLDIARGLAHLHELGVVHRDIAARNILLDKDFNPKVSDFGMSRKLSDSSEGQTNSTVGPIRWMSPESIGSLKYSTKSDVWSFGCLCAEILTRKQPHPETDDIIALAVAIRDTGRTPLLPSSCPEWLRELIEIHIWNYDPNKRPEMKKIIECFEAQGVTPLGSKISKKASRRWHGSKAPSRIKNTYTSIQANSDAEEVEMDEKKR